MCTLVILRRPGHRWPILLAANRDEMLDRPWQAPARHWSDRPTVTAGRDQLAGGTWLGLNDDGLAAAVLNRVDSLGPAAGKRSRGELVLEALDHADAGVAAAALAELDGAAYRPFNLVVVDAEEAFWLRHDGRGPLRLQALPEGLSMITAHDLNAPESARIRTHLPRFQAAPPPDPDAGEGGDWSIWEKLLASQLNESDTGPEGAPEGAMCIVTELGFGTVNSSLIALPTPNRPEKGPIWRFAGGPPHENSFITVRL